MPKQRARVGRPSLTGRARTSPQVGIRITPKQLADASRLARETGRTVSQVTRDALDAYLTQRWITDARRGAASGRQDPR